MTHRSRAMRGRILKGAAPTRALPAVLLGCLLAGTLTACDSGDGGDNGGVGSPDTGTDVGAVNPDQPAGLAFSYPVDGQTDVYPGTTIAFAFNGDAAGDVQLVDTRTGNALPARVVDRGNGIFNIYPAGSDARMAPATTYAVVAQGNIGDDDNTAFANGDTLFAFSTAAAGGASTSSDFTLVNFPSGNDAGFPINGESFPFTQFNTLRARFSQPVDEGSVKLCTGSEALGNDNCTVAVTGPDGSNVAGRLSVLGKDFVFDPGSINPDPSNQDADQYDGDDLQAGVQYTVNFDDDFVSASGNSLSGTDSFNVTPLGINTGDRVDVVQRLRIGVIGNDDDDNDSMSSPLTGRTANNIELASQLIGSYDLAAVPSPEQGGLQVRLAAFNGQRFGGKIPTVLPRGQKFQLGGLNLAIGSQLNDNGTFTEGQVDTPVNLDNLDVQFANDSDVYLLGNDLRNVEGPTRVTQRLDLNIFGQVSPNSPIAALSNGVVNQTALNVLASGIAIPQDNGDIALILYGSLPISVNRDAEAAANFELELTLPASVEDQPEIVADVTSPRITAQYPSACSYTFNTVTSTGEDNGPDSTRFLFQSGDIVGGLAGTTTLSDIESNCSGLLTQRVIYNADEEEVRSLDDEPNLDATFNFPNAWPNSLPLGAAPSILFSEPVASDSVNGNVSLIDEDGNRVSIRPRVEGASVVLNPISRLMPDTTYNVMVNSGITDLAGNSLTNTRFPGGSLNMITFNTEPMVVPYENGEPATIDRSQNEAVRQTAPFLTALTPGLPCALQTVDQFNSTNRDTDDDLSSSDYFRNGGNKAGRCVGDRPTDATPFADDLPPPGQALVIGDRQNVSPASPQTNYSVFSQPANAPITAHFSKPVRTQSIKLATECLVGGGGSNGSEATVAVQIMNGGSCDGVVEGVLNFESGGSSDLTTGFSFKPAVSFQSGKRYWLVICGGSDPEVPENTTASECSSQRTIIGQSGLALNTSPLAGMGGKFTASGPNVTTNDSGQATACNGVPVSSPSASVRCLQRTRGEGGPDILMPFNGSAASANYATTLLSLPTTDTNGNGFFDNTIPDFQDQNSPVQRPGRERSYFIGGFNTDQFRGSSASLFNEEFGRERAQFSNSVFVRTLPQSDIIEEQTETAFLSGARPIIVEAAEQGAACSPASNVRFDNGTAVVQGSPSTCVPVALPAGGLTLLTALQGASFVNTGQIILRFPEQPDADGNLQAQKGYIVPSCSGTDGYGNDFNYQPCFVGDLTLRGSAPDAIEGAIFAQQDVNIQVYGPVAFEQNGRLVISVKNANAFSFALGGGNSFIRLAVAALTREGDQALQLVGAPIHGGPPFALSK